MVQEVASDPCNIRMHAERDKNGILVQTDPISDCSGNPVPDGTIVTFTSMDANGKSTVDARIKRGVAQAQLPASSNATISVAAGVVVGNEIQVGRRTMKPFLRFGDSCRCAWPAAMCLLPRHNGDAIVLAAGRPEVTLNIQNADSPPGRGHHPEGGRARLRRRMAGVGGRAGAEPA